jgi:hypothetical protein
MNAMNTFALFLLTMIFFIASTYAQPVPVPAPVPVPVPSPKSAPISVPTPVQAPAKKKKFKLPSFPKLPKLGMGKKQ